MSTSTNCLDPCHRFDVSAHANLTTQNSYICQQCLRTPRQAMEESMTEALRDWRPPTLLCRLFCPRTLRLIHPEEDTCCCTQPCTRQEFFLNIVRVIMTTPPLHLSVSVQLTLSPTH